MLAIKTLELEKVKSKITTEKGKVNPNLLTRYYLDGVLIGVEHNRNVGTLLDFSDNEEVVKVLDKYLSDMKVVNIIRNIEEKHI